MRMFLLQTSGNCFLDLLVGCLENSSNDIIPNCGINGGFTVIYHGKPWYKVNNHLKQIHFFWWGHVILRSTNFSKGSSLLVGRSEVSSPMPKPRVFFKSCSSKTYLVGGRATNQK